MIDPTARRSATVVAVDETIAAWVTEQQFSALADKAPRLWRRIAIDLADRLRQRGALVRARNTRPRLFIGSSSEALPTAEALRAGLVSPGVEIGLWSEDVFEASDTTIESLEAELSRCDFAVLVLSPDDQVLSRKTRRHAPRDNVIFELGMFMGALTRGRTYIVQPKAAASLKIPTDLLGITVLSYDPDSTRAISDRLVPVCESIRKLLDRRGCR